MWEACPPERVFTGGGGSTLAAVRRRGIYTRGGGVIDNADRVLLNRMSLRLSGGGGSETPMRCLSLARKKHASFSRFILTIILNYMHQQREHTCRSFKNFVRTAIRRSKSVTTNEYERAGL